MQRRMATAHDGRFAANRWQTALFVGLTAVFVGYLAVWLAGPAAGLRFLGVEMGEWLKFLGVGVNRNLFYLPPITLGLMLALLSATWSNRRWQTWALRGTAVAVSLLAFPALEDLTGPSQAAYMPRVWLIGLVLLVSVLAAGLHAWGKANTVPWLLIAICGILGAVLPTWLFFLVRPMVAEQVGMPIGIGIGVWLNGAGHLLTAAVAARQIAN